MLLFPKKIPNCFLYYNAKYLIVEKTASEHMHLTMNNSVAYILVNLLKCCNGCAIMYPALYCQHFTLAVTVSNSPHIIISMFYICKTFVYLKIFQSNCICFI